jgi:diguanylate cyclase (GGDEF)-like protein
MAGTSTTTQARSSARRWAAQRWLAAGLLGSIFAVTVTLTDALGDMPLVARAGMAALAGWLVMVLFAPWRAVLEGREQRQRIGRLARSLHRAVGAPRGTSTSTSTSTRTDEDTIGHLASAVEHAIKEVATGRNAVRRLEERMGERIQRETHRRTAQLKQEAFTDPLTGLGNRRAFDQRVTELGDGVRGPVTALLVDVDRFKAVNDALGHEVGDDCLVFLGDVLRTSVRTGDIPVRLGGDEFLVLMPGQTIEDARPLAERLSRLYDQMPWRHRDVGRPGLSIGLAESDARTLGDGRALLRQADSALYRAKRAGRGRVMACE